MTYIDSGVHQFLSAFAESCCRLSENVAAEIKNSGQSGTNAGQERTDAPLKYREELRSSAECCNQNGQGWSKPREKLRISDECCAVSQKR
jgi:hypothetical protein